MKQIKKGFQDSNSGIERPLSRHESWKNNRRHTALKLIRFS
ncbi:hypothetical protein [Ulvibacterium marinum]|nr:hypothetical protein [Ulvibacterium marinum]